MITPRQVAAMVGAQQDAEQSDRPVFTAAILHFDLVKSERALADNDRRFLADMLELRSIADEFQYQVGRDSGNGDQIWRAFTDTRAALECAIALQYACARPDRALAGLPPLVPRIVLHWSKFTLDSHGRVEGRGQISVARLDPVVTPGEIWATDAFADVVTHLGDDRGIAFDYLGMRDVAKGSPAQRCYALRLTADSLTEKRRLPPKHGTIELASELFDRGDEQSQLVAVAAFAAAACEDATAHLTRIGTGTNVRRIVRYAALVELQELGRYTDAAQIGVAAAAVTDPETRALLLLALAATRDDTAALRPLRRAVLDGSETPTRVREAALLGLRNFRGSDIKNAVIAGLADEDDDVRIAACAAAAGSRAVRQVLDDLFSVVKDIGSTGELRNVACEALSTQPASQALTSMLAELAQDAQLPLSVRHYALDGLIRSGFPDARAALNELARRSVDELQGDALTALSAISAPRHVKRRQRHTPGSHIGERLHIRTRPLIQQATAPE